MFDPDYVRIDLLKAKRKLYISYPEGSKERTDFLIASKKAELKHLQTLITPDMAELVYEEYIKQLKSELVNFTVCLLLGICFSLTLLVFHQSHPVNIFFLFWRVPSLIYGLIAANHLRHAIKDWNSIQPFREEYRLLQVKIDKLTGELKGFSK